MFCALLWACRNRQTQDLANPGFSPECKVANDPSLFMKLALFKKLIKKQLFDCAFHLRILVHFRQLPLETYCSVQYCSHAEICRIRIWQTQDFLLNASGKGLSSFSDIGSIKKQKQLFDCACHLWILVHFRQLPLETFCSVQYCGHAEICRIRIWQTQDFLLNAKSPHCGPPPPSPHSFASKISSKIGIAY